MVHDRPENSRPDLHVVEHPRRKALSDGPHVVNNKGPGGRNNVAIIATTGSRAAPCGLTHTI